MLIPVQNIYYLLSYAWDFPVTTNSSKAGQETGENTLELLCYLLQTNLAALIKKGLAQGYIAQTATQSGVKGKVNIGASVRDDLFRQGKTNATFQSISPDILVNQLIKATLHRLLKSAVINKNQQTIFQQFYTHFNQISLTAITPGDFKQLNFRVGTNPHYKTVLPICELLLENLLPDASGAQFYFTDFMLDEKQMARLFEAFVRNFYLREQQLFTVKSEKILWQQDELFTQDAAYLPQMITDISLKSPNRNLIIDTKYYKAALTQRYDKQKIISGHLYQLFAYLKNQKVDTASQLTEGILLYPVLEQELDLQYLLHGHKVSIKTINLNQDWQQIKADLLKIIA